MKLHRAVRLLAFGLLLLLIPAALSTPSSAQIGIGIGISVRIGPPALPVYEQPLCPGPGYLWTPGYWAWSDDDGYYWVPGTWVVAPVGMLWTPGYWGWNDGIYAWNAGYWGPHIGFYGGINYGFGYGGVGFGGGEWRGGAFFYNTAVVHVNTTTITNVYVNRTVIVNNDSHVAFNGGEGGVAVRPTPQEEQYSHETRTPAVAAQVQQEHAASQNKALFASNNHGAPAVAATARPGEFNGAGVVRAKAAGAPYRAPAISPREARASAPAAASRPESNRPEANRPESNRPAETRPMENRPASENRPAAESRPNSMNRPPTANRPATDNRPPARAESAPRTENSRPQAESRPQTQSRPQAESRPSAPASKPAAAPKKQSAPKEEKHDKGR